MVLFTRRTTAKPGKFLDLVNWAKELAVYINEKFGTDFSVYSERYGGNPLGTIFWVGSFESMSKYEEFGEKLLQDDGYMSRLPGGVEMIVGGASFDNILEKH
jgi:hypothetical protein